MKDLETTLASKVNKDDVMQTIADITNQRVNEVGQNKEAIKQALVQDQPLNKFFTERSYDALLNQKVNEVAQSKEPIKAALSQEIPISNSFIERSYKIKPLTLDDLRYYTR